MELDIGRDRACIRRHVAWPAVELMGVLGSASPVCMYNVSSYSVVFIMFVWQIIVFAPFHLRKHSRARAGGAQMYGYFSFPSCRTDYNVCFSCVIMR